MLDGRWIAALGESALVQGFALVGVRVIPAEDANGALAAWRDLPAEVDVVILTPAAARALGGMALNARRPLTVVLPP